MSKVKFLNVKPDEDNQRLDRYLRKHIGKVPFSLIQKIIRTGQVRVDGKRGKTDTRLSEGQQIRIPPVEEKHGPTQFKPRKGDLEKLRAMIIYDDGDLLVLNKPYGVPTQGGSKINYHIDGLLKLMEDSKGVRPKLTHRLDRDTSGLLICARSAKTVRAMGQVFKSKNIRKYYWAVTIGVPEQYQGIIDAPLGKGEGALKDTMVIDTEGGKASRTEYSILDTAASTAALVAFWPRTGRTHQIRAHASTVLGTPILGDVKYGGMEETFEGLNLSERLHLHAFRIQCPHPNGKGILDLSAPLPDDLKKSWKAFNFASDTNLDPFDHIDI